MGRNKDRITPPSPSNHFKQSVRINYLKGIALFGRFSIHAMPLDSNLILVQLKVMKSRTSERKYLEGERPPENRPRDFPAKNGTPYYIIFFLTFLSFSVQFKSVCACAQ